MAEPMGAVRTPVLEGLDAVILASRYQRGLMTVDQYILAMPRMERPDGSLDEVAIAYHWLASFGARMVSDLCRACDRNLDAYLEACKQSVYDTADGNFE